MNQVVLGADGESPEYIIFSWKQKNKMPVAFEL